MLILHSATLLNSFIGLVDFFLQSLRFSMHFHVFCIWWQFYLFLSSLNTFSCLSAVVRTSITTLNSSSKGGPPYFLIPDIVGRLPPFHCWILYWLWVCHKWLLVCFCYEWIEFCQMLFLYLSKWSHDFLYLILLIWMFISIPTLGKLSAIAFSSKLSARFSLLLLHPYYVNIGPLDVSP